MPTNTGSLPTAIVEGKKRKNTLWSAPAAPAIYKAHKSPPLRSTLRPLGPQKAKKIGP